MWKAKIKFNWVFDSDSDVEFQFAKAMSDRKITTGVIFLSELSACAVGTIYSILPSASSFLFFLQYGLKNSEALVIFLNKTQLRKLFLIVKLDLLILF